MTTKTINVPIEVLTNIIEHNGRKIYQYAKRGESGSLFAFPFFDSNSEYIGYLAYFDKDATMLSDKELILLHLNSLNSLSGMVGNMSPLPYNVTSAERIEMLLDKLIIAHTHLRLNGEMPLPF